jgi:hypothetical protein
MLLAAQVRRPAVSGWPGGEQKFFRAALLVLGGAFSGIIGGAFGAVVGGAGR